MSAIADYPVITELVSGDKIVVVNASGVLELMTYDDFIALQADAATKLFSVGDIKHSRKYTAISEASPWFCLNRPSQELLDVNYPDYCPWLRDLQTGLFLASGSPQTAFAGTVTTGASGIITLTTGTNYTILMAAIEEHYQKSGAYVRCKITNSTVSQIKYGTLALYSLVSSQVQFSYTGWTNSDVVSIELYPNIVYDGSGDLDSTKAYHTQIVGDALMAADDPDGRFLGGMGRRSRLWGHYHLSKSGARETLTTGSTYTLRRWSQGPVSEPNAVNEVSKSDNWPTPILDSINTPPATGVYIYEYVGRYIA